MKTREKKTENIFEFPTFIKYYIVPESIFRGCRAGETTTKSRLGGLESSCLFSTKVSKNIKIADMAYKGDERYGRGKGGKRTEKFVQHIKG